MKDSVIGFIRRYPFQILGCFLVLWMVIKFAFQIVSILTVVTFLCLIVGWKKPDEFRFLFRDKTSSSLVRWTFGGLLVLFALIGSSLEPDRATSPAMDSPVALTAKTVTRAEPTYQEAGDKAGRTQTTASKARASETVSSAEPSSDNIRQSHLTTTLPPAQKLSLKQQVEELMRRQFRNRFRSVEVNSESYTVAVSFNNSLRFSTEATKKYIEGDMKDAYRTLFTSGLKIREVGMVAYGESIDKYGKESRISVYQTALTDEVAHQIDWDNYRQARWDELWTVVYLHRDFRPENRNQRPVSREEDEELYQRLMKQAEQGKLGRKTDR